MFGGKKLKDLTEEDIRQYAASLVAMHGGGQKAADSEPEDEQVAQRQRLAQAIAEGVTKEDAPEEPREEERVGDAEEAPPADLPLSAEEQARLQVLAELDRCQMPAVKKDGSIQKTIEHYAFADAVDTATIIVEVDKDLFDGASKHVAEEQIEVVSKDNELTVILHGVPTTKTADAVADWTLRLSPLCHSVESGRTTWKVRKGKVSVKLAKRKPQEWKRAVKV